MGIGPTDCFHIWFSLDLEDTGTRNTYDSVSEDAARISLTNSDGFMSEVRSYFILQSEIFQLLRNSSCFLELAPISSQELSVYISFQLKFHDIKLISLKSTITVFTPWKWANATTPLSGC